MASLEDQTSTTRIDSDLAGRGSVRTHIPRAKAKTEAHTSARLVAIALPRGLIAE